MVPYVRKSFYKHFKDGMKYIQGRPIYDKDGTQLPYKGANKEDEELSRYNDSMSILASEYKWYPNAFRYAMDMTKREIHQAVEGLYHNLNTL